MSTAFSDAYQLRATLTGHSGDVRAVTRGFIGAECILSGSRDKTACVWTTEGGKFIRTTCLKNHEKYVSSVAWRPPGPQAPQGLLLTGGLDKLVNVYDPLLPTPILPVYTLQGHKDAVSCIATHGSGLVLTGSWDCTAKLWGDSFCVATLEGHELAVWGVEMINTSSGDGSLVLATASADKTIRIWNKNGQPGVILKGHTDAVRGLVSPAVNQVLSCSNDATVRHWDVLKATCLAVYYGHTNYIYGIALLGSNGFVTSGEDASVRVWNVGTPDPFQTIRIPARSIWCVTTLQNGDIVAGGSDGHIRVFTRDATRVASQDQLKAFEEEITSMQHSAKEVLDGIKTEDLPSDSVLNSPGEKDGQTKLVRGKNGNVQVYNWSSRDGIWQKIGDVVGSSGGSDKTSGRTLFQGKEYDFVFSVDFDESRPPVKLPYNRSDDPWVVAQKFLEDNELPQSYLDTVAKFITQNVPDAGATAPVSAYADPFTGSGRYVPGGGAARAVAGVGGGAAPVYRDPFTGSGAYVSGGGNNSQPTTQTPGEVNSGAAVYPVRECLGFHAGNVDGILKKLKEHMDIAGMQFLDADLEDFRKLMQKDISPAKVPFSCLNALGKTLDLPEGKIFPALDLLRLAVRQRDVCDYFCDAERVHFFLDFLLPLIKNPAFPANQQLALKILCNTFLGGPLGSAMLSTQRKVIISGVTESAAGSGDKNVQIARATLFLNYAVGASSLEEKMEWLFAGMQLLKIEGAVVEDEALFRVLCAVGTILTGSDDELRGYAKVLEFVAFGESVCSVSGDERVRSAWKSLQRDFFAV